MTKQEFLDGLRVGLQGSLSAGLVMDNVSYYEDYINAEVRKGKTEAEVLSALGDPRLIAKTIVQTQGNDTIYNTSGYYDSPRESQYQGSAQGYQSGGYDYRGEEKHQVFRLPGWLVGLLILIVVMLVFGFIFSVLAYLAPVILVLAAVVFVVKLFQDWLS
ncbi:MAG: DUF1700 domain-containing protein [Candidatus Gastranaerophilales bacterium]|nr:DUF1700 domain-containing protein [Candidatus Gastranaerophilales bacterium]